MKLWKTSKDFPDDKDSLQKNKKKKGFNTTLARSIYPPIVRNSITLIKSGRAHYTFSGTAG